MEGDKKSPLYTSRQCKEALPGLRQDITKEKVSHKGNAAVIEEFWKSRNNTQKALIIFVLTMIFRAVFSLNIGLIDDEAYHWSWTKDLQLSYFDHPAMIAWLESITTQLFGDTVLAVRLPSFLCFAAIIVIAFKLTQDLFDFSAACFVGLIMLWSPFWGFGGYVASPETPFMLCWMLATWIFWQGVREDGKAWSLKKTWLLLGLVMGLGLNSKFIIALLAPGFGLYMLMSARHRKDLLNKSYKGRSPSVLAPSGTKAATGLRARPWWLPSAITM